MADHNFPACCSSLKQPVNISIKQHKSFWKAQWGRQYFFIAPFQKCVKLQLWILKLTISAPSNIWPMKRKTLLEPSSNQRSFILGTEGKYKTLIRGHLEIWVEDKKLLWWKGLTWCSNYSKGVELTGKYVANAELDSKYMSTWIILHN